MVGKFEERMRSVPDEELYYVLSSDTFTEDAVLAARAELRRRGIDEDAEESGICEVQSADWHDDSRKHAPLSRGRKMGYMFLGPTMLPRMAMRSLEFQGYERQADEARTAMNQGFVIWALAAVLLFAITRSG